MSLDRRTTVRIFLRSLNSEDAPGACRQLEAAGKRAVCRKGLTRCWSVNLRRRCTVEDCFFKYVQVRRRTLVHAVNVGNVHDVSTSPRLAAFPQQDGLDGQGKLGSGLVSREKANVWPMVRESY